MNNLINIGLATLVGFGVGVLVMKTSSRLGNQQVTISTSEEMAVKSIFSSGCEVGIMKYCEISKQEECRKYCLLFLEANPDVLQMLLKGIIKE